MSAQDRDCIIGLGSVGLVNLVMVCITAALFHKPGLTGISNLAPLVNRPDPAGHWHAQLAFVDTGITAHLLGQDTARLGLTRWSSRTHDRNIHDGTRPPAHMASTYHQLGLLAQARGDYDEATRQCAPSTSQSGWATRSAWPLSQLGILEAERDGTAAAAIAWHVKAFAIRLRLRVPQAVIDLRRLAAHRSELGPERFTSFADPGH